MYHKSTHDSLVLLQKKLKHSCTYIYRSTGSVMGNLNMCIEYREKTKTHANINVKYVSASAELFSLKNFKSEFKTPAKEKISFDAFHWP